MEAEKGSARFDSLEKQNAGLFIWPKLVSEINSIADITHTLSYFLSHCPATFILYNNNNIK